MFKKTRFIAIITVIVMLLSVSTVHAQYDADHLTGIVTTSAEKPLPVLQAQMAILVDASSGTILYDKSSDVKVYPASTTKMMTLIVALESGVSLSDTVTVSAEAASIGGSSAHLRAGDKVVFKDLLYSMMLPSGNDASYAIGEAVAGSAEKFVEMMNAKAKQLKMVNTSYRNTHGIDAEGHQTTCQDMAVLALHCMKNEQFRKIVSTKTYTMQVSGSNARSLSYTNTNKLLTENFNGATGIKTGTTGLAGATLVASATRGDTTLIAVIMHDLKEYRFSDAKKLLEYGFNYYATIDLTTALQNTQRIKVENSLITDENNGELTFKLADSKNTYYTAPKDKIEKIRAQLDPFKVELPTVTAPVQEGAEIGTVVFKYGDEVLLSTTAIASESVAAQYSTPEDMTPLPAMKTNKIKIGSMQISITAFIIFIIILLLIIAAFSYWQNLRRRRQHRNRRRSRYVYRR